MNYAIKATGITKDYGSFRLDGANLCIRKGFVTGLIGNNGAGKSTLMKCITGAVFADSGTVEFAEGITLSRLGIIFDECPFPQYFSCERLSKLMKSIFPSWNSEKYFGLLKEYGISSDKKVKDLSRGMGMKLQAAVAFSHETDLLILDEPTAGMDPAARDEFLDELREYMQDENHSILISSHITSDLEKIADYVVFLKNGKVMIDDERESVEENYGLLKTGNGNCPVDREYVVCSRKSSLNTIYLVNDKAGIREAYPEMTVDDASLEDIMVMMARGDYE